MHDPHAHTAACECILAQLCTCAGDTSGWHACEREAGPTCLGAAAACTVCVCAYRNGARAGARAAIVPRRKACCAMELVPRWRSDVGVDTRAGRRAEGKDAGEKAEKPSMISVLITTVLKNPYIWGMALTYFFIYVIRQGVTSWFAPPSRAAWHGFLNMESSSLRDAVGDRSMAMSPSLRDQP